MPIALIQPMAKLEEFTRFFAYQLLAAMLAKKTVDPVYAAQHLYSVH